jgi:hypothetical protein
MPDQAHDRGTDHLRNRSSMVKVLAQVAGEPRASRDHVESPPNPTVVIREGRVRIRWARSSIG